METLYDRLLEICRDQGIENPRPTDISKTCGLSSGRPKQIRDDGAAAKLGAKSLQRLVSMGYSPSWIQEGKKPKHLSPLADTKLSQAKAELAHQNVEPGPSVRGEVPLISWVQAGQWCDVVDNYAPGDAESFIPTTVPIKRHTYALRVKNDSMTNPNGWPSFPEGMIIIVEPEMDPNPGDFVIVRNGNNESTFKQLIQDGGEWLLKPLNPRYPINPMPTDAQICGVVRGYGGMLR